MVIVNWVPNDIRRELDRITANNDIDSIDAQIVEIEALARRHSLSIRLIKHASAMPPHVCYENALCISDGPSKIAVLRSIEHQVEPNYLFMDFLLKSGVLCEIEPYEIQDGDLVVYGGTAQIKHAGRVDESQVLSKWGIGHLWRHNVWDVPAKFGEQVRYFESIDRDAVIRSFETFARSRLVNVDERLGKVDRSG